MPHAACAFCRIVSGEAQASIVFADAISLAFLDYRPLFPGHCLLIPRVHYNTFTDIPADVTGPFFLTAQMLSRGVQYVMKAEGTFVAINNTVSQSVPHFHVHVAPRRRGDGLKGFFWPRQRYQPEEMERVRTLLADWLAKEAEEMPGLGHSDPHVRRAASAKSGTE